jgi:hypothetical protein
MQLAPGAFEATAGICVNTSCHLRRCAAAPGCVLGLRAPEGLARESAGFLVPGGPVFGCNADRGIRRCLFRRWIPPGNGASRLGVGGCNGATLANTVCRAKDL